MPRQGGYSRGRSQGGGRAPASTNANTKTSKSLSYLLRHGAADSGIPLTEDGYADWADISRLKSFRGVALGTIEKVCGNFNCEIIASIHICSTTHKAIQHLPFSVRDVGGRVHRPECPWCHYSVDRRVRSRRRPPTTNALNNFFFRVHLALCACPDCYRLSQAALQVDPAPCHRGCLDQSKPRPHNAIGRRRKAAYAIDAGGRRHVPVCSARHYRSRVADDPEDRVK